MPARRAFNRFELLIVFVVIALLVGLLLPSVSQVRKSAARLSCANKLRQVGLATYNYREHHGHFPPGTVGGTDLPPDQRLSVYAVLLPYLELSPLYDRLTLAEPWDSPSNAAARSGWSSLLPLFCPTGNHAEYGGPEHAAVTNYVGVAGLGADAATLPGDDPRIGVFGYDRRLKADQVKDGLANTALFVETNRDPGPWARGGPSTVRGVDPADRPLTGKGRPFGGLHRRDTSFFWQNEHVGSNVGLADGSVRYLRDDADPAILIALATVAGGEPVPADW